MQEDPKGQENTQTDEELVKRFEESQTPDKDFTSEDLDRVMKALENPQEGKAEPDVQDPPQPEPKEEENVFEPEKKDKSYVPGEKFKQKADEANNWKRQLEAERQRKQEIEKQLEELKQSQQELAQKKFEKPENIWDDNEVGSMYEKIQRIEARLEQQQKLQEKSLQEQRKRAEQLEAELKGKATYEEFRELQSKHPELATESSIEDLDRKWQDLERKLGKEDTGRYLNDAEFRRQKESEGIVSPGKTAQEQDTYRKLIQIHNARLQFNYPTARAAYLDKFWDSGVAVEQKAQSDQQKKVAEKAYQFNQTPTLPEGSAGNAAGATRYTDQQINDFIDRHPNINRFREPELWRTMEDMLAQLRGE